MDNLSHLISLLAPQGTVDLHCSFSGHWVEDHLQAEPGRLPYHVILNGQGRLVLGDKQWLLSPGDVLLLPGGAPHRLKGLFEEGPLALRVSHHNGVVMKQVSVGEGPVLEMLCGEFWVAPSGALLLTGSPELLRVRTAERPDCEGLRSLVAMLGRESASSQPGSSAIVRELSTTLFTLLLRALVTEAEPTPGLLTLLANARLAPAVGAVLAEPWENWTLERLAEQCHLSRATFARYFGRCTSLTPQEWVTQVRMTLAARLLSQGPQPIGQVAEQCGYLSQAAFSRAFKLHHGLSPGWYRRQQQAPAPR
ncbi:AraC family transcriptional regulator [Pseudomonas sp. BN417]|uniref:AraC family transcriptional regulator n=1 Tax=Pseudomonas sp. BN417 TaxID=2567890 RepID=UPI002454AC0A|nr:AraC family transcriptional regulator [Pseudomonas sp. BN417]MDH4557719.1 AraC family transcriptional regulator [Pseudomonas sp. BN417]